MSLGLPAMVYADGIRKHSTTKFRGYNHNLGAGDGEVWDMENLTSDLYPLMASRGKRYRVAKLECPNGLFARDGLYWADGTGFYDDGVLKGEVSDTKKIFACLGAYIVIMPDKKVYNTLTGELISIESSWIGTATIKDGTYAEEEAKANTIKASGVNWSDYFSVGDAVTISSEDLTIVIREIDGDELRFYENSFTDLGEKQMTISRTMPDMDYICENENRLWGCKGDTIYASKLGDVFNWNVFDGVSTDSYAVNVGSAGDFTGCTSYLGYPCFFKEEHIYKAYGDKPSNFQIMGSASMGVHEGSHLSFAIAGEILFYLTRAGIAAYSGGIPQNISAAFGTEKYKNAVAGSDGVKYYVSLENVRGGWSLFVYDTRVNMWHREDALSVVSMGWYKGLYMLADDGTLWLCAGAEEIPAGATAEDTVQSFAEFGDIVENDPNKKGVSKIQVRIELDAGARVTIDMQFDSDGTWREVKTLETDVKRSWYLPIIPRRSDHFKIRIRGEGGWKLYSLVRESYSGSEL